MNRKIGVIGLGYVGLAVAIAFARKFNCVVGYDIDKLKVDELGTGYDRTGEVAATELRTSTLRITADSEDLKGIDFFIVTVPTPVNKAHRPDLSALIKASVTIGRVMKKGAIIVYESTVYPGVTEEICGPVLARVSGLTQGTDFKLGYSPERINPGDKVHRFETITKVVSGEDPRTLDIIAEMYGAVVEAGVYRAPSIKVAEAAKVIENTQRDLNIALMNELAIIFEKMKIRTADVLEAAKTKWNFIPFQPGLVGGHCIGVDPYYLTYKAEEIGYHPEIILAGRRINDGMGKYVAEQTVKHLARIGNNIACAKVGLLGLTFKEDVPDLRNSRVPDIITELKDYNIETIVHDPIGCSKEAKKFYGLKISSWDELQELDALILAVAHKEYRQMGVSELIKCLKKNRKGVFIDVKSVFNPLDLPDTVEYWSL